MLFTALAGALIVVPVWLATRAVGGSAGTAWIAALIIETLPAHLHRTFGYWVRYDALGGLLIAAHVAFVLRALRPTATRRLAAVRALETQAYAGTFELLMFKLRQLAFGAPAAGPLARLQLDVIELFGLTPAALAIGPQQFLALGPWFFAAPLLLAARREWRWRDGARLVAAPGGLLAFLCAALTVLALAFSRNKVLLAPWVAVVCAMAGAELWAPRSLAAAGPPRSRAGAGSKTVARAGLMALRIAFVLCALATAATGALLAESRRAAYDRDLSEALAFLRQHTAAGAAVAAPWWYGYETQAVAERPTVTDGLLESRENQRRILELFAAWVA